MQDGLEAGGPHWGVSPKNKERCSFLARNQNCLKINVASFRHKSLSLPASQRQSLKTNWTKLKSKT